jgi:hypothetical protein
MFRRRLLLLLLPLDLHTAACRATGIQLALLAPQGRVRLLKYASKKARQQHHTLCYQPTLDTSRGMSDSLRVGTQARASGGSGVSCRSLSS